MVTSAVPREGKTLTATNLALTLSGLYGRRVLLIDADLRRPSVHELLRLPNRIGLGALLRADLAPLPLVDVSPQLSVLVAGPPDASPMAALASTRMKSVLEDAGTRFDWVIVDTPPVGLLPDANLIARWVDGVLLVIAARVTHYRAVQDALALLGPERVVGTVLNGAHAARSGGQLRPLLRRIVLACLRLQAESSVGVSNNRLWQTAFRPLRNPPRFWNDRAIDSPVGDWWAVPISCPEARFLLTPAHQPHLQVEKTLRSCQVSRRSVGNQLQSWAPPPRHKLVNRKCHHSPHRSGPNYDAAPHRLSH